MSLLATFDFDRTLEFMFITLSLRVKVLDFEKEGEFKEEKEYDRINKVMLVITVEQNI